jgi:hypothetical protein
MSATIVNSQISPVIVLDTSIVKDKKPTLPAKYSKNLVFGFWLLQNLQDQGLLTDHKTALDLLQVFSDVPQQKALIDGFFDEVKVTSKNMKLLVRANNKPSKKTKKTNSDDSTDTTVAKKRGRKVKPVEVPLLEPQESLIQNLVAAANTNTDNTDNTDKKTSAIAAVNDLITSNPVKDNKEKVVKEKVVKEKVVKEKVVKEKVVKEKVVKEKVVKEKVVKAKKDVEKKEVEKKEVVMEEEEYSKVNEVVQDTEQQQEQEQEQEQEQDQEDDDEVEVEIEAQPFTHDGVSYFIDKDFNLYHHESFDKIGSFDHASNSIIPC